MIGDVEFAGEGRTKASGNRGGRLESLDVFRGLTVAGMILVNNPGSGRSTFAPLKHADWDGLTPTDLVFPFFLFIVGVSIAFALSKRLDDPGLRRGVVGKILRRSAIIFGIGLALNKFPSYQDFFHTVRIPGVLQRIALCYLGASLIFLKTNARGQAIIAAALLVGYWALMTLVPVPGFGAGDLRRGHDLASFVDRWLFLRGDHKHLYKADYDPEGLLSTLPALAETLLGVLAGRWLRSGRPAEERASGLFVAGTAAAVLGWAWGLSFPINKALWTGSFALLTAGMAMIGLATCYWLVDLRGLRRWAYPFRALGGSALFAYTLSAIGARLLDLPTLRGGAASAHARLFDLLSSTALPPHLASLAYAASFVVACTLVVLALDAFGLRVRA